MGKVESTIKAEIVRLAKREVKEVFSLCVGKSTP